MKIKSIIAFTGLLALTVVSSAFVAKPASQMPVENTAQKEDFLTFLSQFKKVDLPFSIGVANMEGYRPYREGMAQGQVSAAAPSNLLKESRFLPGSAASKFSRMGPPELVAVGRFYPNKQTVAVVYASKLPFGDDLFVNYMLMLYDLNGNILPRKRDKATLARPIEIAHSTSDETMTCSIDASGHVALTTFRNKWKKPLENFGYEGNKLVGFEAQKTAHFRIDEKGSFVESKQAASIAARP